MDRLDIVRVRMAVHMKNARVLFVQEIWSMVAYQLNFQEIEPSQALA